MDLLLTFIEPQHAMEIEDALDDAGYICRIIHTPECLLDVNVFFCKTALLVIEPADEVYDHLISLPVACVFQASMGRYVQIVLD
ncbi:hypothetical protein ABER99_20525 [Paenibacillus glucanolyticus]|jgi:hypothetical protein|uniref:Uncharacterized protein n=1 Tax=Paenibacillus glucanolyticus TaxID=59843 RepID=A0A163GGK4_9BACL|nr:hypothetical protein [Paenibacillus glucanolyticus]KZS44960.1 hypothetical protein AWU65_02990 [Paenibacillus glucanolyticus]OMF64820.1 hypothetical protein BK142_31335 [Paenibacillus glucanolyticus]